MIVTSTPLHQQYQQAAQHAAVIVEAASLFDLLIPAIIPLFSRRSPNRGITPPLTFLHNPNIKLQRIGGTVKEIEEEQRQAYLKNPNDFFGPPPGLTPSPVSSSNMHLNTEDNMLIPPNSPPSLPHPIDELLMMAAPESPLPTYSPALPSYQVHSLASTDCPLTPNSTQVDKNEPPHSLVHSYSNTSLEDSEGYPAQPGVRPDETWFSNTG